MKHSTKWVIGLGVGIPAVLILIGLIGLIIKFFMKRCRKKPWDDITTLPKDIDSSVNDTNRRILPKRRSSDRQPIYPSASNSAMEVSESHISIPIDENAILPNQPLPDLEKTKEHDHTLGQIQRDRLNRLKEENRIRPMIRLIHDEHDIQRAIDQAQKEFEQSV
jgi:hypothetical protein